MNIFEISTGFTPVPAQIGAATEIVVENLIRNFTKKNDITLIDVNNDDRGTIDCPVKEIKMSRWLMKPSAFLSFKHKLKRVVYSSKLALLIKKLSKKETGSIFHFHNQYNFAFSYAWTFLFRKNKHTNKWIYTVHSNLWFDEKENKPRRKHYLEIYSIRRADIVICLNPQLKENIKHYFKQSLSGKTVVIPNGVDHTVYFPIQKEKTDNRLKILNIGSVYEGKNQLKSIEILSPLLKSNDCLFYFAGANVNPAYMEQINSYIKSNGLESNVSYLGEIPPGEDLNKIYNTADLFLSNSKSESFGLVALEALATGIPAILSQTFQASLKGLPPTEAISFCNDDNDFYLSVKSFMENNDKLETFGIAGRKYIETFCSWEKIALQHEKILI